MTPAEDQPGEHLADTATTTVGDNEAYLEHVLAHPPAELRVVPDTDDTTEPAPDLTLPNLPYEFWDARPELKHIRAAAHSRGRSADLVLYALLARLSAIVDPGLTFDTGLGRGSLNLFAAVVAGSGVGKTSGGKIARELVAVPQHLDTAADDGKPRFHDGLPLGSGEGMAEAFMGTVRRETGEIDKKGTPVTERVRTQVRRNAFFSVDEGEQLTRTGERSGSTIGPTIRSAWVGELLGQANASEDRIRVLPAGTYSLGMLVGYQPETAAPLLADSGPGTPQRFIWCSGHDPNVPTERTTHPGPLCLPLTDLYTAPMVGVMHADDSICEELWARTVALSHGELTIAPLDAHEPLMRSKLAALLALLDGRDHIRRDDWDLSLLCWETSCAVRDGLITHGAEMRRAERDRQTRELVARQSRVEAAASSVPQVVQRIAEHIARKVVEGEGLTNGAAWRALAGRDRDRGREVFEAALEHGAAEGYFVRGQNGLAPGVKAPQS